jgi:hypothetical protein
MKDLIISIPIGISSPGTPILKYLKKCVESIKNQKTSYSYEIIFACDENVSIEVKNFLNETGYKIKWYDSFYFFRKGSIWKKIYDQWLENEGKYIAFSHYDDMWHENKIENQLSFMENSNSDLSWSSVYVINSDDQIISTDLSSYNELSKYTIRQPQSYAFSHSSILKKDTFLDTGILDVLNESSRIYEELHFIFCHKLKGKKISNSIFYHRSHTDSISTQFKTDNNIINDQRKITNYSLEEELQDAKNINVKKIIEIIESNL